MRMTLISCNFGLPHDLIILELLGTYFSKRVLQPYVTKHMFLAKRTGLCQLVKGIVSTTMHYKNT